MRSSMQPILFYICITVGSVVIGTPLKHAADKSEKIGSRIRALDAVVEGFAQSESAETRLVDSLRDLIDSLHASIAANDEKIAANDRKVAANDEKMAAIRKQFCRRQDILPAIITYSGTAGATSEFSATHSAENAFKPQESGEYPWANIAGGLPATVWYRFDEPQTVAKISLRARNDQYHPNAEQAPEDIIFKGSDDCENWVTLKSVAHAGFTVKGEKREFEIPCSARAAYTCYGMEVSRNHGNNVNSGGEYVSIQDTVMYG